MSKMACCADDMPVSNPAGGRTSPSETTLAASHAQCCMVIVAGGVNAAPVVMEHSSAHNPQKSTVRAELPGIPGHAGLDASASPIFPFLSSRSAAFPCSVEKHVLNAVFLI